MMSELLQQLKESLQKKERLLALSANLTRDDITTTC